MRVISALFLKQTLAVANVDAERVMMQKMKEKERFANVIREIFISADTSGDGAINAEEFKRMVVDPVVGQCFEKLGLEVYEVVTLFHLLADDDGIADYEEFLEGALKMKNSARTIDVIQILHEHMKLGKQLNFIIARLDHISQDVGLSDSHDIHAPSEISRIGSLPLDYEMHVQEERLRSTEAHARVLSGVRNRPPEPEHV